MNQGHKKTTGIILRRIDLNEADQIVTVLTKEYGKIALLAKGSRRMKSRFSGRLELLHQVELNYFQGRGDLGHLNEVEGRSILEEDLDLKSRSLLFYMAETTTKLVAEGQACEELYDVFVEALQHYKKEVCEAVFYGYLVKSLTALGFMSGWDKCSHTHQKLDLKKTHYLSLSDFNIVSSEFSTGDGIELSQAVIKWVNYMQKEDFRALSRVNAGHKERADVFMVLKSILGSLVTSPFKSEVFLSQI